MAPLVTRARAPVVGFPEMVQRVPGTAGRTVPSAQAGAALLPHHAGGGSCGCSTAVAGCRAPALDERAHKTLKLSSCRPHLRRPFTAPRSRPARTGEAAPGKRTRPRGPGATAREQDDRRTRRQRPPRIAYEPPFRATVSPNREHARPDRDRALHVGARHVVALPPRSVVRATHPRSPSRGPQEAGGRPASERRAGCHYPLPPSRTSLPKSAPADWFFLLRSGHLRPAAAASRS